MDIAFASDNHLFLVVIASDQLCNAPGILLTLANIEAKMGKSLNGHQKEECWGKPLNANLHQSSIPEIACILLSLISATNFIQSNEQK